MNDKVAAVVVTYNRKELLKECIGALLSQEKETCDILIIDNCSTDGTDKVVEQIMQKDDTDSRIQYYNTGENMGGAGGFYYGMKKAMELGYKWLWLMDDDTIPKADALYYLLRADKKAGGPDSYGYISSVVEWTDGTQCKMNSQKSMRHFFDRIDVLEEGMFLLQQATFVSLFVPAQTVKKVGYPIKEYFIWGDDIEYTRRISIRNGMPSFIAGKSHVIHKMNNNNGSFIATDGIDRLSRYNYAFRNDGSTYMREGFGGFIYFTAKCALNFFRCIFLARDHRLKRSFIVLRGYFRGLVYRPGIEKYEG